MKKWNITPGVLGLLVLSACSQTPQVMPTQSVQAPLALAQQRYVPIMHSEIVETIQNQVIVKYRSGFRTQAQHHQLKGAEVLDAFNSPDDGAQLYKLPQNVSLKSALNHYTSDPSVEFAIPNVRFQVKMSFLDKVKEKVKKVFGSDDPKSQGLTPVSSPSPTPEASSTPVPSATPSPISSATPTPSATSTPESISGLEVNDPLAAEQWHLDRLNLNQIWAEHGTGNPEVTVAVLDTGVDYDHPDLKGKVIKGPDYVDKDYDPKDLHGHGTHVAGIVAARLNNQKGVAGVAPNVKILAIRVLDENGSGSLFRIAKGIAYAANHGAKVINLSLGSPPGGSMMRALANFMARYAERKGALVVAAAGNDGGPLGYPAAAKQFLSVGAINQNDILASFSNRGKELDVVAPGVNIMSTFPTYPVTANENGIPQNYAALNGTSMATPVVAAEAALIWSRFPYLKPSEVKAKIESNTIDLGSIGKDDMYGLGLVNLSAALQN